MSSNKQEQSKSTELNQEYMLEMMSLPNSEKRKMSDIVEPDNSKTPEIETEMPIEKAEPAEKKEPKRKKQLYGAEGYETVFIKPGELNVRNGKAIYIRSDFHRTIARIVQTIGDGKVSLTDYVDNVFAHHFKLYEQEIKESFNKNNEPNLLLKRYLLHTLTGALPDVRLPRLQRCSCRN